MPYEVQGVDAFPFLLSHEAAGFVEAVSDGVTADGTALSPALGVGVSPEKTLVHSGQCTKVDGVERAFERMHHGDVLRSVVTW